MIKPANYFILRVTIIVLFFLPVLVMAETKTFIKEYSYQASESDSKVTSRNNALAQVKRQLLEELGSYLESHTEVKNYELNRDQIVGLTAGIVQTKILDEQWNGNVYWVKAEIKADPAAVSKAIERKRNETTSSIKKFAAPPVEPKTPLALASYYGSKNSRKYHRPTCDWAQKISRHNLIVFKSTDSAKRSGYEPCSICNP